MAKHLWYLSEKLVGLALVDSDVPAMIKRDIVKNIKVADLFYIIYYIGLQRTIKIISKL